MFGSIGMTELIVIFVVALIVIGPQRLPELARTVGKALGDFKRAASDLQDSLTVEDPFDEDEEPIKSETSGDTETEERETPTLVEGENVPDEAEPPRTGTPASGETPAKDKTAGENETAGATERRPEESPRS